MDASSTRSKSRFPALSRRARRASAVRRAALAAIEPLESRRLLTTTVSGTVFVDHNGDGVRGAFDFPAPGVIVYWDNMVYEDEITGTYYERDPDELYDRTNWSGQYTIDISGDWVPSCDALRIEIPALFKEAIPSWYDGAYIVTDPDGTQYDFALLPFYAPATHRQAEESDDPVRYQDGVLIEEHTDLASEGGIPWAHTRSWTNHPGYTAKAANGNGWVTAEWPSLTRTGDETAAIAITSGSSAQWFNSTGGANPTFTPRHDSQNTLHYADSDDGSGTKEFVLTDTQGNQTRYFDDRDTNIPEAKRGSFKSFRDAAGSRTSAVAWDANGNVTDVRRTLSGGTTIESYKYDYTTVGSAGQIRLASVTLRRSITGETGLDGGTVGKAEYTYYDGSGTGENAFGNEGDLKTVKIRDKDGNLLETKYYRYYVPDEVDGFGGALKFTFSAEAYDRLAAALPLGITPLDATDEQFVARYATKHFKYDSAHRVWQQTMAGFGSTLDGGDGRGTFTFVYHPQSAWPDGYNNFKYKTEETLPDGTKNFVYTNFAGQAILTVHKNPVTNKEWCRLNRYDNQGRLVFTAHPSAFKPDSQGRLYNEGYADLVNDLGGGDFEYLDNASGLIEIFNYFTGTTTATESTPGDVTGYLQDYQIKRGDQGTPVMQSSEKYFKKTYAPSGTGAVSATVYRIASHSIYRNDNGTGELKTDYEYTYFTDGSGVSTAQLESIETKAPVVGTGQNGPDGTERDTETAWFDQFANLTWVKDADGYINHYAWDPVTGGMLKKIADVNTSNTADFTGLPSGWATPAGGGLHLITTRALDPFGRTTRITHPRGNSDYFVYNDAQHEVISITGWDSQAHTATGPIQVARQYRPTANAPEGRRTVYTEVLTTTAPATYDLQTDEPTGVQTIDESNIKSLRRELTNDAGQVTETDAYFSLSGVTYSQAAARLGFEGNDSGQAGKTYHPTFFDYESAGRTHRLESAAGTIYRTVYDANGQIVSEWVGTDDTGATEANPAGAGAPNNMRKVVAYDYDDNGNPTKVTLSPQDGTLDRVTQNYFDWRDRLIASKSGVQASETDTGVQRPIVYAELDNLDQVTALSVFDGDGVTIAPSDGVPQPPSASLLRAKKTAAYDDQGRVYRSNVFSVNPATGAIGDSLAKNLSYDRRGNVIKTAEPGGLVIKEKVDGAGRLTEIYLADGGGDTGWDHAGNVAGDVVLTQRETVYDANGNRTRTITRERFPDETLTGKLGGPTSTTAAKARVSYAGMYYDAADRLTGTADIGTNGGSSDTTVLDSLPARSDDVLVSTYDYDDAGNLYLVTDPKAVRTKSAFDLLGREMVTIEAWDGTQAATPADAANRTTRYTYTGLGDVRTMTADLPSTQVDQTTQYSFGVTTAGGSTINSNELLGQVWYPNPTSGAADSTSPEQYSYNGLGDVIAFTDQNGNAHGYTFDVVGRPTGDRVTIFGTGVDPAVKELTTSYDEAGRVAAVKSLDATGGTLNSVAYTRNGFGQITAEAQARGATTATVGYAYSDTEGGTENHSRLTAVTYPNGRVVRYDYLPGTLDDRISRVSELADQDAWGGSSLAAKLEQYTYLGLSTAVKQSRPEPGVELSYGTAADQFSGLDRFGRVVDQKWTSTRNNPGSFPDRFGYTYDRNSNRLTRDVAATGAPADKDEAYVYDDLDRLAKINRGTLSGGTISDGSANYTRRWDNGGLDALGNWKSVSEDADGGGGGAAAAEERTHDARNRLTGIVGGNTLQSDKNGNTTRDEAGQQYVYDAWDRVVQVKDSGGNTTAGYTYDPLGRRRTEIVGGVTTDLYHSLSWQVLEERTGGAAKAQNVWGLGYIDDLVLRDRDVDTSADGTLDSSFDSDGKIITDFDPTRQDVARTLVVQPDGKIIAAGASGVQGTSDSDFAVARYNRDGSLDSTFDGDGLLRITQYHGDVWTSAVITGGKILLGGYAYTPGWDPAGEGFNWYLARLNADGSLDTTFGTRGDGLVVLSWSDKPNWDVLRDMIVLDDGKIVAVGEAYDATAGKVVAAIARFNPGGTLDSNFSGDGKHTVQFFSGGDSAFYSVAAQPGSTDGKVTAAGYGNGTGSGGNDIALARFTSAGALDTAFDTDGLVTTDWDGSGGSDSASDLAVQPDGKAVIAATGADQFGVARYTAGGALDTSFNTTGKTLAGLGAGSAAVDVAVLPDGKVLAAGYTSGNFGPVDLALARLTASGAMDSSFDGDGLVTTDFGTAGDYAYAMAVLPDGNVVLAGASGSDFALARYKMPQRSGGLEERLYAQQDANHNVTSIIDVYGAVKERYRYDPYGSVTVLNADWTPRTGNASGYDWDRLFQGGRLETATGNYHFRRRDYRPSLGRPLQADPTGYADGANLYLWEMSNPGAWLDPWGTDSAVLGSITERTLPDGTVYRDYGVWIDRTELFGCLPVERIHLPTLSFKIKPGDDAARARYDSIVKDFVDGLNDIIDREGVASGLDTAKGFVPFADAVDEVATGGSVGSVLLTAGPDMIPGGSWAKGLAKALLGKVLLKGGKEACDTVCKVGAKKGADEAAKRAAKAADDPRYARPSELRSGVRDKIWDDAIEPSTGRVRDPGSGRFMANDKPWDAGHKPKCEFRKHQKDAAQRDIDRPTFLDEHNDPSRYRPELPGPNRDHSGEDLTDDYLPH